MFWGLIMEPNRRYTQTVQKAFHISKAALDLHNSDEDPTQLILTFNNRNYLLCTLQKSRLLQCSLNLNFDAGDQICFAANGKCNIHLSGYLIENPELEDDDEISEDEEDLPVFNDKKRKVKASTQQPQKKSKTEELLDEDYNSDEDSTFNILDAEDDESDLEEEAEDEEEEDSDKEEVEEESSLSEEEVEPIVLNKKSAVNGISKTAEKKKKKQKQKEQKLDKQSPTSDKTPLADTSNKSLKVKNKTVEQVQTSQKRTIEGGVLVQDLKVGEGAVVKPGKTVQVYYEGRLKQNNKVFDSNLKGTGFKFRVGKQEVIKGWDVGLIGMKVGGKRRISCPPAMAYGVKGSPPVIPPNSTLVFEVEVKNII